jgi:hypothetical protein
MTSTRSWSSKPVNVIAKLINSENQDMRNVAEDLISYLLVIIFYFLKIK